jgi:hypothetical protein
MQLKTILRQVPDPRGKQAQDYRLWSILGLIVVSLCGRRGMKAAFLLGRRSDPRQKAQLGFVRGTTPCHATLPKPGASSPHERWPMSSAPVFRG